MKNLIIVLWRILWLFVGYPFALALLNVFIGAFFGWFIGLFFGDTILGIFAQIGISGFSMWQIGAFLGFVCGFFRKMFTFNDFKNQTNNIKTENTEKNISKTKN